MNRLVQETEQHPSFNGDQHITQFSYLGLGGLETEEQQTAKNTGNTLSVKDFTYDIYGHRLAITSTPYTNGVAGTPTTSTYGYDTHGSVSQLVDPNGNTTASYGYTPYGQSDSQLSQGDPDKITPINPFRYSAKRVDTGSGTLDMGVRRFGPDTSHFLTPDFFYGSLASLSLSTDTLTNNRYGLAGGNPISFKEWDGHTVLADGRGGASTTPTTTAPGVETAPPWWQQAFKRGGAFVHGIVEGAKVEADQRLRPLKKSFNDTVEKVTTTKQVEQTVTETIGDLKEQLNTLKSTIPAKVDETGQVIRREFTAVRTQAAREVQRDIRFSERLLGELEKDRAKGAAEHAAAHERLGAAETFTKRIGIGLDIFAFVVAGAMQGLEDKDTNMPFQKRVVRATVAAGIEGGGAFFGSLAVGVVTGAVAGLACDAETVGICSLAFGVAGGFIGGVGGSIAAEPAKDTVFGAHWLGT